MLGLPMWHMDVSNAFQSAPAPLVEGKRIWLRCFPECLMWLKERHPDSWKQVNALVQQQPARMLALEMFKMVQGRVDASCRWQELIEKILMHSDHGLCLKSLAPLLVPLFFSVAPPMISSSVSETICLKILATMKTAA
jgi:hypothetical protein